MHRPDEELADGPFAKKRRKSADSPPRLEKAARDDDDDDDDDDDRDRGRSIKKRRKSSGGNAFVDFLLFKKMVGPWVLLVLYWLAVIGCLLGGIGVIIMSLIGMRQMGAASLFGVLWGLAVMLIYPIVLRIYFELMITVFRIYETLVEIRDKL